MFRLLFLTLFVPLAALGQGSSLERFQTYVRTTQGAQADFEQKVYDSKGKLTQQARGSFAFQRPGKFRWTYAKPNPQLIVGDGERVWIYDEDLKQVTVRRMEKAIGSTPAALLAGAAEVEKAFELTDAGERDGLAWVEAKPREKEAGFERVRLGLGASGVEAMELWDNFGQKTVLRFVKIVRNPKLDPADFRFTPPKGADVLGDK
jgi:outer membrane lipoprotein carrier protein